MRIVRRRVKMLEKYKEYSLRLGLMFAVAVGIFGVVFTWIIFSNQQIYARMIDSMYDCGIDAAGAMICAALFYGCMKQKGDGALIFRLLIILVSAGFLVNELINYTTGAEELHSFNFLFVMLSKLIDLVLIFCFYQYLKITLEFKGELADLADKGIPILLGFQILVLLSNIVYPLTFMIGPTGEYQNTGVFLLEDIFLIAAALVTTILIIRSQSPHNQKVAALLFLFLPLLNYTTTLGEFGNASQYGVIMMSLIVMYCIIFNDKSTKLASTQTELNMAREIQTSLLPSIFPAFPDRKEFDLYASMDPAKEVGGDFYDFFLIDENHLGVVIADVSGKGVPAALFMMISKTVVQNFAMLGIGAAEVLNKANEALCAQNKMKMFVTTWIGILELSTGKMTCANAGHECPVICHDGKYNLFKDKHGFVLGGLSGMKYKEYEIQLEKGDKLFVYTDGVTEATNANDEFFGAGRMVDALNSNVEASPEEVLRIIRESVDEFVGAAEQFDDLTMLCLEYRGLPAGSMKKNAFLELEGADLSNLYAPKQGTAL